MYLGPVLFMGIDDGNDDGAGDNTGGGGDAHQEPRNEK